MVYKEKSMEMSKFFFMGFVEKDKRLALIETYVADLENQLNALEKIKAATEHRHDFDEDYLLSLQEKGAANELKVDNLNEIALFQCAMLDLSIDKIRFEIQWFKDFKRNL
jgi:hypothetical protein